MLTTGSPTNWAGNITFSAARCHRPTSLSELRRLVAGARRVRALGSGHSFNRVADTDGDLIRLDGLPRRVELDAARRRVTVSGGMRYGEFTETLHQAGLALENLASLPHISVAGACATGTHGSGDGQRSLAAAVAGLEILGPDGELRHVDRDTDAELLHGAVVNLGALGLVTGVTLDLVPTFQVAQWVYTGLPLDTLAERFDTVYEAAYSVSVFTDWHSGTGRVWLKRRVDTDGADHPGAHWLGATLATEPHHPVPGMPPAACTDQFGEPGPWYARLPHFRPEFTPSHGEELQSELLLPRAAAAEVFAVLRRLGGRIAPVLQTSEVRTVAADRHWLSPAYGRDSVAVHFTWIRDTAAVLPVLTAMEEELLPLGARPHWGKLTTADPAELRSRYERAEDFRRLLADMDPNGVFRNAFVDSLFPA